MQFFKTNNMKNNKILENRPELTNEQIMQGMDFSKIKNNAALAKAALLKSFIIKGLLGIIVISSGVFIYKNYTPSSHEKQQSVLHDTAKMIDITEKDSFVSHSDTTIDKKSSAIPENKTVSGHPKVAYPLSTDTNKINTITTDNTKIITDENIIKDNEPYVDTIAKNQNDADTRLKSSSNYRLNRYTKCKLWKPRSFCDIPGNAKFANSYDVDNAEYDYVSCQDADKNMAAMKAVWITINVSGRTRLQLESHLKNITLIKSVNGKLLHPVMIAAVADGSTFFGENFKAKKFVAHYNGQLDIFLFFSEAEIGDTIIINNFIKATILE